MIKSFVGVEAATNPVIFEDLFRLRHEIYIVRRKWGALRHEHGLERDSYDNSDAVYLIGFSTDGKVNCGLRLLPTMWITYSAITFSIWPRSDCRKATTSTSSPASSWPRRACPRAIGSA
jgi:N-acyl-L-homoserine lactone synthetase